MWSRILSKRPFGGAYVGLTPLGTLLCLSFVNSKLFTGGQTPLKFFQSMQRILLRLLILYNSFKCPVNKFIFSGTSGPIAIQVLVGTPPNSVKPASVISAARTLLSFAFW